MSITIELPPETERKLHAKAEASGQQVSAFVLEAVEEKLRKSQPTFAEILAPIHEGFRESGMSEAELDALFEQTLSEVRKERREKQSQDS